MLPESGQRSGAEGSSPVPKRPLRIAGVASHRGTNLRHIDDACRRSGVNAELALLISNNSGSSILAYAEKESIPWKHLSSRTHPDPAALDQAFCDALVDHAVDLVFLSGYMKRLGPKTVDRFRNRILNVHPALLPAYGGQGMYGDRVYEAVLENGDTETGATVHLVDEEYDHGRPVKRRIVPVKPTDDVEKLRNRVRQAERELCLATVAELADGRLDLTTLTAGGPLVGAGA
jgi:phosphoribosylglycinamide formyltransferase-1